MTELEIQPFLMWRIAFNDAQRLQQCIIWSLRDWNGVTDLGPSSACSKFHFAIGLNKINIVYAAYKARR